MSLVGIITPSGKELRWKEYLVSKEPGLFPRAVRNALFRAISKPRTRWISVTTLLYCLRKAKWEFERDYFLAEGNAYYLMRGNLIHEILSSSTDNDILVEYELKTIIPGTTLPIGGQLDLWENDILYDYKTMAATAIHILKREGIKDEYKWQPNIYKWMLKNSKGLNTKEIKIVFLTMSKLLVSGENFTIWNNKRQEDDVFKLEPIPIYTDEKVVDFLKPKILRIEAGYAPPASPQPWLCKACYFKDECMNKIGPGGDGTCNVQNKEEDLF